MSATNPMLPAIAVLRLLAGAVILGDKVINEQARNVRFPEYNPVHNNSIANHFEAFVRIASQFDLPRQDWVVLILATFKGGSALDLATQWILIQPQDQLMDFEDFRRVLVEQVDGRNLISDTSIFESRALRADESIPDYVNVLRDLAAKSLVKYDYEQREDQVARQFKRGLTGVLRQEVLKSDFMEIDKLQAKAISFVTLSG